MFTIYVKSKKDRDAVSHATNYPVINVKDKEEFSDITTYGIYLAGRDEKTPEESPTLKVIKLRTKKVRNATLNEIREAIEIGKFRHILDIFYDKDENKYILGKKSNFLEIEYGTDISYCLYKNPNCLIWHKRSEDILYSKDKVVGKLDRICGKIEIYEPIEKSELIYKDYFKEKLKKTIDSLINICENKDEIVIPWSGGKDSTCILILAKKYLRNFTPIFVNTQHEFEENLKYIESFGIKYEEVTVDVKPNADKSCTHRKVSALYNYIRKNFANPLILVGDRISESKSRSDRPQFWKDEFEVFAPIKFWSIIDIQLLFKEFGYELNPLYKEGFYRIGCKTCPFLDEYSKIIYSKLRNN